jgi:threonine/homoserine/homoserine lactone efflux protein
MTDILGHIFGFIMLVGMGFLCYIAVHLAEEKRQGKHIPLPWEKKKKDD